MADWLAALSEALSGSWGWFVAAGVLMLLELALPGVFLFWLGLAALATGFLDAGLPLAWQVEMLLFGAFAVAFVVIGRGLTRRRADGIESFLNRRGDALVGREFILGEPIVDGAGRVRVDDSVWRVVGPDMPAGGRVRVLRVEGASLVVGPA